MGRLVVDPGRVLHDFHSARDSMRALLSGEFIDKLISAFSIPPEKKTEVTDRLCSAAWLYQYYKERQRETSLRDVLKATRKELIDLVNDAEALSKRAANLSKQAVSDLEALEEQVHWEAGCTDRPTSSFGHTIVRRPATDGAVAVSFLQLWQLCEAVRVIANLARAAGSRKLPADRGGKPRNEALHLWVGNMRLIWEKILDRAFTLYTHEDCPATDAGRFCKWVLSELDPQVSWAELGSAIRAEIGALHRGRGGRAQK